jgi:hypothetical protein
MPIPERSEYETLIYGLPNRFPEITASTIRIYSTSASAGMLEGEIVLKNGIRIQAVEVLDFGSGLIRKYSYTVYRGDQKIRWYDPQPHPGNVELAATFPHHYHEEPGPSTGSGETIKTNRRPAPGITFDAPNLPGLIENCLHLGGE